MRAQSSASAISFDKVLVTDGVAWTLFWLAQREGLLYTAQGEGLSGHSPSRRKRQAALSLILLFDKLIVHDLSPGFGSFRLPDLERDGILEIVAATEPSIKVAALKSSWKPSKSDPRRLPPSSLRRSLALVQAYKPLIVDRLVTKPSEYDSFVARSLGISKRAYYGEFLDLATHYALGNSVRLRDNVIERAFPRNLLNEIKRELFDFQMRGDELSPTNATIVMALIFAEELGVIQELSTARGLGVATQYYTQARHGSYSCDEAFSTDPSQVPRSFGLVRSILHEEGHFFPELNTIADALRLRKNPHLLSFKEQFREFHVQLARGDRESFERVRKEVTQAKRALERTAKWNLALRWLTYVSLPSAVAESLLGGLPLLSSSLAVMSVAGTAVSTRAYRKNEWALFGA